MAIKTGNILKKGEKMTIKSNRPKKQTEETCLDEFKREMEPAKKIYTEELKKFAGNFDSLGKMRIFEDPDIDTQEYIYAFEKLNGAKDESLDETLKELYRHMDEFSKENGIEEFKRHVIISFNGDYYEYH